MIKKIIIIALFILLFSCQNQEQDILVDKIVVDSYLCENCIGLRKSSIKYFFKSDFLFQKKQIKIKTNDTFFYLKNHNKWNPEIEINYFEYDSINQSEFGSLNEIKKGYSKIIFFKEAHIIGTSYKLKTTLKTRIIYVLNNEKISEDDFVKMNKSVSPPTPARFLSRGY